MQKMAIALILIIFGLIVIAFPFLGLIPISVLSGFLILMLGFGLILTGIFKMGENDPPVGIIMLILGTIALILGIGISFNPILFTSIESFIVWIMGLFLIIEGIARILSRTKDICGVKNIIIYTNHSRRTIFCYLCLAYSNFNRPMVIIHWFKDNLSKIETFLQIIV